MSATMIVAPSLAIATAQARPIPLPAPVTSATLSVNRPMSPPVHFFEGDDLVDGPVERAFMHTVRTGFVS